LKVGPEKNCSNNWERIDEDRSLSLGKWKRTIAFGSGTYDICFDGTQRHRLFVTFEGHEWTWHVERIHRQKSNYRISGMAEPDEPVLSDHAWFELWIVEILKIVYWGDRVVVRTDFPLANLPHTPTAPTPL